MPYYVDLPVKKAFAASAVPVISGWLASERKWRDRITLSSNRGAIPYAATTRKDVEVLWPGYFVLGFFATLQPGQLSAGTLAVEIKDGGQTLERFELSIPDGIADAAVRAEALRRKKRIWCLEHGRCPVCRVGGFQAGTDRVVCGSCGVEFPQRTSALNMLPAEDYAAIGPENPAATSSNAYNQDVHALITAAAGRGGKVLDCGSGMRPEINETVINLDIADYPLLDVLSVGRSLPFADGVFDAVLSIAVLEHVSNPFECAAEIVRVLAPGGRLFAQAPLLSPEHGYPHHFYNMTRSGLRNLFREMQVEDHTVPLWGRPILALHWFAREYAGHLGTPEAKKEFLSMTFGDLIARTPGEYLDKRIVSDLSADGNWTLACMTQLKARKP